MQTHEICTKQHIYISNNDEIMQLTVHSEIGERIKKTENDESQTNESG